jgi:hypothetical protein
LTEKIKELEESSNKLISNSCHTLDTRIDDLLKDHLSVHELIGKDCQYSTMSDWAKNFTANTLYSFEETKATLAVNAEKAHT